MEWIEFWADMNRSDQLTDQEFANAFLDTVMEAPLDLTESCTSRLPARIRPIVLEYLTEFAARDFFDDRHAYVSDGLTIAERRAYLLRMQPHFQQIGEHLFRLLDDVDPHPCPSV